MAGEENGQEEMRFSLKREKIKVVLEDPTTGTERVYFLQSPDGEEKDQYLNLVAGRVRINKDGNPAGVKDFKNFFSNLISKCMVDEKDKHVPAAMIDKWPATVQMALYDKCQELAGMDQGAEERAKNS